MKLTEAFVLAKTAQASLEDVRSLNLWGNGLSDVSARACERMQRCAKLLTPHALTRCSPTQVVAGMTNLEVLSLSVNRCGSRQRACYPGSTYA